MSGNDAVPDLGWALSRIDIRSPLGTNVWPVARVELQHPVRGRVTDVASAPGAFDAAFAAASHILGIQPTLLSFNVLSGARGAEGALGIRLEVELALDGTVYRGSAFGLDLLDAAMVAWLAAASKANPVGAADAPAPPRPFQVSGLDEDEDLWIFASGDPGAADAVAADFRKEGYSQIRQIGRGRGG